MNDLLSNFTSESDTALRFDSISLSFSLLASNLSVIVVGVVMVMRVLISSHEVDVILSTTLQGHEKIHIQNSKRKQDELEESQLRDDIIVD